MTLRLHPGPLADEPAGLKAMISGGVVYSFPGQNGQNPPFFRWDCERKSVGLFPRSIDMMTHRPTIGSFLSSGILPPSIHTNREHPSPAMLSVDGFRYYITYTSLRK